MNGWQKSVLFLLSLIALLVSLGLGLGIFWLVQLPKPTVPSAAPLPPPTMGATPSPAVTPGPVSRSTATPPPPTATSTRVVTQTVFPSPTATVANCVAQIHNFADSGVLTDEQVGQFLDQTIPLNHLDHCRGITYVHTLAKIHGMEISGSTVPVYREINVFQVEAPFQTAEYLLDTLTHEIGHNVLMNFHRNNSELYKEWGDLNTQSRKTGQGFVSDYARTNKEEDFAESYMAYIRYPQILKAVNPVKYEFMRQYVFGGQEYAP